MKIISTLCFVLFLSLTGSAQVFWTETFGSGCNQGQTASGVTTSNGTWTVGSTGQNDGQANQWYISAKEDGTGAGNCSNHNCLNSNQSLHISSNDGLVTNDRGCDYDAGGLCSYFSVCVVTNARAQSPVINCSGKSTITLTFNYIEGGDGSIDNGTCWYYDGSSWTQLVDMPKTTGCGMTGTWTAYSIALPSSANNNPNVKIGFNWTNDDDGAGTDPSLAVDDVQLSVASGSVPPVAHISTTDTTSGCSPLCFSFTDASTGSPTSWKWTFTGSIVPLSTDQNPQGICYNNPGNYSVKLVVSNSAGKDSITLTNFITVVGSPPTPTITQGTDTLYSSYDPSYTSYQWYDSTMMVNGATNSYLIINHTGNYNLVVSNSSGCSVAVGINVTYVGMSIYTVDHSISLFPNPATSELTINGNWSSATGLLSVFDALGRKVREENVKLIKPITVNIKNLPKGIYSLQIANDSGKWTGMFVKE